MPPTSPVNTVVRVGNGSGEELLVDLVHGPEVLVLGDEDTAADDVAIAKPAATRTFPRFWSAIRVSSSTVDSTVSPSRVGP
jgi:hypothetical protein